MTKKVRIIPHAPKGIADTGSFEVRVSHYIYWEGNPGRAAVSGKMTKEQALKAAQERAREEQERLDR